MALHVRHQVHSSATRQEGPPLCPDFACRNCHFQEIAQQWENRQGLRSAGLEYLILESGRFAYRCEDACQIQPGTRLREVPVRSQERLESGEGKAARAPSNCSQQREDLDADDAARQHR
eukprot:11763275-Alexandrium_andersonii.AAC.1